MASAVVLGARRGVLELQLWAVEAPAAFTWR